MRISPPRILISLIAIILCASAAAADRPALASLESEIISLVEEVEPSIVSVVRGRFVQTTGERANPFGPRVVPDLPWNNAVLPDDPSFVPDQFGAGVIISAKGNQRLILTNQHVVSGGPPANDETEPTTAARVYVRLHDGRGFYARIRAADPRSDLAVLIPEESGGKIDLPPGLPLSDAESYKKGELVFVFGNPYGVARDGSASVAWGIIGNVLRQPAPFEFPTDPASRAEETIHHYGNLLQLDCRADLGFSGGATVNREGELIGLTTSLAALEGYESTAGFAIPINAGMRRIIHSLLKGHEPEYGFLGVVPADVTAEEIREELPEWMADHGAVRVESVKPGSAGDQGDLRGGDLILSVNNQSITSASDLFRQIGLSPPGVITPIKILRQPTGEQKAERMTIKVRLDKWPVVNDAELVATVPRYEPWRGLHVDYATARSRFLTAQLEPYPQGVVILAAEKPLGGNDPLQPGDFIVAVNKAKVESPEEFYSLVRDAEMVTLRLADGRDISVVEKK